MKFKRGLSLNKELAIIGAAAFIICMIIYFLLSFVVDSCLDYKFNSEQYYEQQDKLSLNRLAAYVSDNDISSDDWYALNKWVDSEHLTYLGIYMDGALTYDSQYSAADNAENYVTVMSPEPDYLEDNSWKMDFSDGEADVIIYGRYASGYYQLAYAIEFLVPCLLYVVIILLAVRKKVIYIKQLCNDIHIMEGGNLDYPVTVKGTDELGLLASSLDELRKSFIQKIATIMQLQEDSKALVTEMSHDMRTPMTPLLVYLGMLRDGKFSDESQMHECINKSYEKATQLKHMTDNMFSYFLMDKSENALLEDLSMKEVFYDQLSGMADYLETSGFKTQVDIDFSDVIIHINMDFIARIMNNLVSNVMKYADRNSLIVIKLYCENNKVILHFGNVINALADYSSSTGFGVKNIKKMMGQMNAECIISQKHESYDTFLLFKVIQIQSSDDCSQPE